MRPLWDYPPGVRAPGEGVAPGEPGSVSTADAINAYLKAEAMFADPVGALDRSNPRTNLASGRTATDLRTMQMPQGRVANRSAPITGAPNNEPERFAGGQVYDHRTRQRVRRSRPLRRTPVPARSEPPPGPPRSGNRPETFFR
jgi:hypothetical protein